MTPRSAACGATDGQAVDIVARGLARGSDPPVVARCFGEPKTITPSGPRSAHRSIRSRMCSPALRAQRRVGRGDVQALGADHQPVQPDEAQSFGCDDVAVLAARWRR